MLSRVAFAFGFLKHEYAVYSGLFFSQVKVVVAQRTRKRNLVLIRYRSHFSYPTADTKAQRATQSEGIGAPSVSWTGLKYGPTTSTCRMCFTQLGVDNAGCNQTSGPI